jgi:UDP-N-acetylmuramoyl-L-alanyl-D-glutamate--2,6-diaminopimelate ligase
MAEVACKASDKVILTSDNPRDEDPRSILLDMKEGVPAIHKRKTLTIIDREEAIRTAIHLAEPGDIILIAGKGHETYQEVRGEKHPFDDKQIFYQNTKN